MIHAGNRSGNLVTRYRMFGNGVGRAILPRRFRGKAFPVNYLNLARYSEMVHFPAGRRFG
jgi:hypothetical protein